MMTFFTSVVTKCKDVAGKLRLVSASEGGVTVENRLLMQQRGFISSPIAGDRIAFVRSGNFLLGFATDSDSRPLVLDGEAAVYSSADCYILLRPDGSIEIKAPNDITVHGNIKCMGDVRDSIGTLADLRSKYNAHTHVGNLGAPTGPTMPNGQDVGGLDAGS